MHTSVLLRSCTDAEAPWRIPSIKICKIRVFVMSFTARSPLRFTGAVYHNPQQMLLRDFVRFGKRAKPLYVFGRGGAG